MLDERPVGVGCPGDVASLMTQPAERVHGSEDLRLAVHGLDNRRRTQRLQQFLDSRHGQLHGVRKLLRAEFL